MRAQNYDKVARQVLIDNGVDEAQADGIVAANFDAIRAAALRAVADNPATQVGVLRAAAAAHAQLTQWVVDNLVP